MLANRGLPSVSVPVLSTATVSTRPSASSASPPLMSTPARAAPPTADTTATGTEITRAQGHATISRASARYNQVSRSPPRSTGDDRDHQRRHEHERRVDPREAV